MAPLALPEGLARAVNCLTKVPEATAEEDARVIQSDGATKGRKVDQPKIQRPSCEISGACTTSIRIGFADPVEFHLAKIMNFATRRPAPNSFIYLMITRREQGDAKRVVHSWINLRHPFALIEQVSPAVPERLCFPGCPG